MLRWHWAITIVVCATLLNTNYARSQSSTESSTVESSKEPGDENETITNESDPLRDCIARLGGNSENILPWYLGLCRGITGGGVVLSPTVRSMPPQDQEVIFY